MADCKTEIVDDESECGKIILLVSGKRKCGKDYLSERIQERLAEFISTIIFNSDLQEFQKFVFRENIQIHISARPKTETY